MRVFRLPYTDAAGTKRRADRWWIEFPYRNAAGVRKVCRVPAFADKRASEQYGVHFDNLVALKASNTQIDAKTAAWIESLPPKVRKKLIAIGVLDSARVAGQIPLLAHLEGEFDKTGKLIGPGYIHHLKAKKRNPTYIDQAVSHVKRICNECGFKYWPDVNSTATEHFLTELREKEELKDRSFNGYVQSFKGFAKWAEKTGRIPFSPLNALQKITITDATERRAISLEEMRLLLAWVETSDPWRKISGAERALIYRFAVETGLRRSEIASLTRASFHLDEKRPYVAVAVISTKNRRGAAIDLSTQMAAILKTHLANKMPGAKAFAIPKEDTADMLRADLAGTRAAWIKAAPNDRDREEREKSDLLLSVSHAGQVLVFHSTRHTRGVWLFEHYKASAREVQDLMRLSSIALVDRYSRSFKIQDSNLVDRGPDLSPPAAQKDGSQ